MASKACKWWFLLLLVLLMGIFTVTAGAVNNPYVGQCIHDASLVAAQSLCNGRHIDIRQIWCSCPSQTFNGTWLSFVQEADSNGSTVHMTLQPEGADCLTQINNGSMDSYFTTFAQQVAAYNKLIYIRIMQESNEPNFGWGQQPAAFKSAFQRISNIFRNNAPKAKIEWNVGDWNNAGYTFSDFNPGTSYYDYAGIDGYNWGTSHPEWPSHWATFSDVFTSAYNYMSTLGKPIIVSEYGCTNSGGDKNAWIVDAFNQIRNGSFQQIMMMLYYDVTFGVEYFDIDSGGRTGYNQAINFPTPTSPGNATPTATVSPTATPTASGATATPTASPTPSSGITKIDLGSNTGQIGQWWGQGVVYGNYIEVQLTNATNGMAGTHSGEFDRNWSGYGGSKVQIYIKKLAGNQNNVGRLLLYDSAGNMDTWNFSFTGLATDVWTLVDTNSALNSPVDGTLNVNLADIDEVEVGTEWQAANCNVGFQVDYVNVSGSGPTPTPSPTPSVSTRMDLGNGTGQLTQWWGDGTVYTNYIEVNKLAAVNGMAGTHSVEFDRNWSSYASNRIRVYIKKLTNNQNNLYRLGLYDSAGHSQWYQIDMSGVAVNTWTLVQTTTALNSPISGSGLVLSDLDEVEVSGDWQSSNMNCCFQVDYVDIR